MDDVVEELKAEVVRHVTTIAELRRDCTSANEAHGAERNLRLKYVTSEKELKREVAKLKEEVTALRSASEAAKLACEEALTASTVLSDKVSALQNEAIASDKLKDGLIERLQATIDNLNTEVAALSASAGAKPSLAFVFMLTCVSCREKFSVR
jgi:vacuolar-type H+-ATPase subunit I/STV1